MNLRRLAAVATALACAFATPSSAKGTVALDGVRRTQVSYEGDLTSMAGSTNPARVPIVDPFAPYLEDCTPTSCDVTGLRVTLPKGTSTGRIKVVVTLPRELNGAVALFNAEGERVAQADVLQNGEPWCCPEDPLVPTWKLSFTMTRLPAGTYTLAVFDRGGTGHFTADVTFKANPPDRRRK